ncbi:Uncharacterised protein [Vibrio cholerae]|uniref:Uncharacterized protein n=1 Tax=Vibrio cholerae TaxID=666 RepID=A0A656A6I5_VIBCL|nr:Uncharacterised protein [Vibrio cholerae]
MVWRIAATGSRSKPFLSINRKINSLSVVPMRRMYKCSGSERSSSYFTAQ